MGLTKPRASQVYNLDYKQSTRVVTVANVTLAGGTPNQVDGVNLSLNDRILVTGQSTASQNGLYYVTTVGSGSNGTWARTSDGNETGEIEAGMIVMVTEGTVYSDTQWKLTTNDPITIGSTALVFTQNYSANSISGGTSNVTVYSNSDITISSAGTSNVLIVSSTGTVTSGTASVTGNTIGGNILTGGAVSATGNVTGAYILGNGVSLTGVITSVANINNGTSNVTVVSSGGNVTVGVSGTGNVAVFATTGEYVSGVISATGNITGDNVLTGGLISATGNVTGAYMLGNGSQLTGIATTSIYNGTSNVSVVSTNGDVAISANGTPNVAVFSTGSLTLQGAVATPKTIVSNVAIASNVNAMLLGPLVFAEGVGMTVPTTSTVYVYAP